MRIECVLLIGIILLGAESDRLGAGGKAKDEEIVAAMDLTKLYTESGAAFDKKYKGKTVTVEGIVTGAGVKETSLDGKPGKVFLMIEGYKKPGDPVSHSVRCEESGPDFEGIRTGHKVRIRGTVQGHKDTLFAAELRDCKVVKVFADDYPPSKAARAEAKKLQGRWKIVGAEAAGTKLSAKQAGFDAISFEGYQVYLHQGDKSFSFGLVLDPEKSPKNMDLTGKGSLPCIYTLVKDELTLTLPGQKKEGGYLRANGQDTSKHTGLLLRAEREKSK